MAKETALLASCFFDLFCVHFSTDSDNLHVTTKKHLRRTSRKKHICKQNATTEIEKNTTDFACAKSRQMLEFHRSRNDVGMGSFEPNFRQSVNETNYPVLNGLSTLFAAH